MFCKIPRYSIKDVVRKVRLNIKNYKTQLKLNEMWNEYKRFERRFVRTYKRKGIMTERISLVNPKQPNLTVRGHKRFLHDKKLLWSLTD